MFLVNSLKSTVENLPLGLARPLVKVPFSLRLGPAYSKSTSAISRADNSTDKIYEESVVAELGNLLSYAVNNCAFYRQFYQCQKYVHLPIKCLEDWQKIPLVSKADFQSVTIEERTCYRQTGMKVNTGGQQGNLWNSY